jgi:hypothetical protein
MIVTYGGHAGDTCARQLRQVRIIPLGIANMRPGMRIPKPLNSRRFAVAATAGCRSLLPVLNGS